MKFILCHIPRTGGTSAFQMLTNSLETSRIAHLPTSSDLAFTSDSKLNSYDAIETYCGSAIFHRLDKSWKKLIILRDPKIRIHSLYRWLRSQPPGSSLAECYAKRMSFPEFARCEEPAIYSQINNGQLWTIIGDKSMSYRKNNSIPNLEMVDTALARLQRFDYVGQTDKLADFVREACGDCKLQVHNIPNLRASDRHDHNEDFLSIEWSGVIDEELIFWNELMNSSR